MSRADACQIMAQQDNLEGQIMQTRDSDEVTRLSDQWQGYQDQLAQRAPEPLRSYIVAGRGLPEDATTADLKALAATHSFDRDTFCSS